MMNVWIVSIHPVFIPHARETVRASFPQEPVISLVYIKKLSSLKLFFSVVSGPSTEPQGSLVIPH